MAKLGLVVADLLQKAGYDVTSEEFKDVLGSQVDVPESVKDAVDKLMDESAAKNNPQLKNHFLENYATGQNRALKDMLLENGFEQGEVDELIQGHRTVTERYKAAVALIKDKNSKTPAKSKEDKELIDKLNADIFALRKTFEEEKKGLLDSFENEKLNDLAIGAFMSKNWSKAFTSELRPQIAQIALQKTLDEMGAALKREGKEIKVVRKENFDQDYFNNQNKKVTFTELTDNIFAANNFGANSPDVPTPIPAPQPPAAVAQQPKKDPRFQAAFDKAMADQQGNI